MLLYVTWGKYNNSYFVGTYGKKITCPKCKNTFREWFLEEYYDLGHNSVENQKRTHGE